MDFQRVSDTAAVVMDRRSTYRIYVRFAANSTTAPAKQGKNYVILSNTIKC